MFFVAESLTEDINEFRDACRALSRAVVPGGSIAVALMEGSIGYDTAGTSFPAVQVSIGEVATAFDQDVDSIEITRVPAGAEMVRTGYEGMLFTTAVVV